MGVCSLFTIFYYNEWILSIIKMNTNTTHVSLEEKTITDAMEKYKATIQSIQNTLLQKSDNKKISQVRERISVALKTTV